jgi:hypothetical protein
MENTVKRASKAVSASDIKYRGGDLATRLRAAGFPQYMRWFTEHNPKWRGDDEATKRIRRILNERGSLTDLALLKECEVLADKYLPKRAA